MTTEGPIVQAVIARLPNAVTALAAFGIVVSLEVTIESPIIMLLGTSTALARHAQAYRMLRRFVLHANLGLTVVAAALAFTPLFDWLVPGLMGIPAPIAEVARPGLQIMVFWSAAIGWRRFNQGILIRFGHTRRVGYGTAVRLVASGGTAVLMGVLTGVPGVQIGAWALMAGVIAEALFVYWLVRPVVQQHLSGPDPEDRPHVSYRQIVKYHAPLAATSLLSLLVQPVIGAGLARMAFPTKSLAAWPVVFSILLFFRSFGFALPETIIALTKGRSELASLRTFSLNVAAGVTAAMALLAFTPLIGLYLRFVTGLGDDLIPFVIPGAMVAILVPGIHAVQSWLRGLLMVAEVTADVYWGMGLNLLLTAIGVAVGVWLGTPGVSTAAAVLAVAMLAETAYLIWRVGPAVQHLPAQPVDAPLSA